MNRSCRKRRITKNSFPATPCLLIWVTRGVSLSLLLLFLLVQPAQWASGQTRARDTSYPKFEQKTIGAKQLQQVLKKKHGAYLMNVVINGSLHIPSNVQLFSAESVVFLDDLDANGFDGRDLLFKGGSFHKKVTINGSANSIRFEDSDFKDRADFSNLESNTLELDNSTFEGPVDFYRTNIGTIGDAGCSCLSLWKVKIFGYADFSDFNAVSINTTFMFASAPVNIDWPELRDSAFADFESWVEAAEITLVPSPQLARRAGIYEAQLRFWKKNFEELGRPRDAREVNRMLIRAHRRFLLRPWNFEWWVTGLLDVLTGYGTHPYRVLWASISIILIFAYVYYRRDALEPLNKEVVPTSTRVPTYIVYSANAFLPLVKLVDQQAWNRRISSSNRWIEMSEKAIGISMIALAAYSIKTFVL